MLALTVGCDPEFFLMNPEGEVVSAHDFLPGNKKHPYPLKHGAVQVDGTAAEFNIDPASSPQEFTRNITAVMGQIREMVPKELTFCFEPSVYYKRSRWDQLPECVKRLGCDPDFSAYSAEFFKANPPPKAQGTMRTGSGHIALGWGDGFNVKDEHFMFDCRTVVKQLDMTLGRALHWWDHDRRRAEMYGKAGCFRPKPFGVEYRTPSNAWLSYPMLWPWIFQVVTQTMNDLMQGVYHRFDYAAFHRIPGKYPPYPDIHREKEPWLFRF